MSKDLIIPCSCGEDAFLRFINFDEIDEFSDEIYISITGQEICSFKEKLKAIWSILIRGQYENYGIISNKEDIKKIIDFLCFKS